MISNSVSGVLSPSSGCWGNHLSMQYTYIQASKTPIQEIKFYMCCWIILVSLKFQAISFWSSIWDNRKKGHIFKINKCYRKFYLYCVLIINCLNLFYRTSYCSSDKIVHYYFSSLALYISFLFCGSHFWHISNNLAIDCHINLGEV